MSLGLAIDIICFGALVVFLALCLKDRAKEEEHLKENMNKGPNVREMKKAS
jgi:hypothetical protein